MQEITLEDFEKAELRVGTIIEVKDFPKKKQIANFFSECLITGLPGEASAVVLVSPNKKVPDGAKLF